ncbi:MAG: ABC transporter ATP-binding protein, partial [Mesorhizobium sp.]
MASIAIRGVKKNYAKTQVVHGVDLDFASGEFVVILGPSGCGKSTLLRMIAGLELPTGGQILLGGDDVTMLRARERDIAFVFQLFALYPHMNVRKNIGFPLLAQGMSSAEIRSRVEETAKLLRIDHLLDKS